MTLVELDEVIKYIFSSIQNYLLLGYDDFTTGEEDYKEDIEKFMSDLRKNFE